ncbi:MAG TPA: DUF951 domain-containing protein [Clostridia bacterium]|nr:DUF951 domain-containing protein [Clostridia bacterium]
MLELNDIVTTKKPHPCGGDKWLVVRTGADFKLKCLKCGHIVLLDSNAVKKAVKKIDKNRE